MGRPPDKTLQWDFTQLAGQAVGDWVDVKLTKLRGRWDVRVIGFVARVESAILIYSNRHGYVWVTPAGFINYRVLDGPYPPGAHVSRVDDPNWTGVVRWVAGREVACLLADGTTELVRASELEDALPTRQSL